MQVSTKKPKILFAPYGEPAVKYPNGNSSPVMINLPPAKNGKEVF